MTATPPGRGRPRSRTSTPFSHWLDERGRGRDWAAQKLGVTRTYIDKLCRGDALPSLGLAAEIETLTTREVTATMWSARRRSSRKK